MTFTITDYFNQRVELRPRIELYTVHDFMGRKLPGLAVVLDTTEKDPDGPQQYAVLTVSFGEFISLRNSAYVDLNNCPFALQLLEQGIAQDTGLKKRSGFCEYPLWLFNESFLRQVGGKNYEKYSAAYDAYSPI